MAPFRSEAVVLLYHRVFATPHVTWRMSPTPAQFDEQLDYLKRHHHIISLQDLAAGLAAGSIPRRSVVLTFDDGYGDNLWNAKPLLERYGIPATVAVTAGYVGGSREFWWDELERLCLSPQLKGRVRVDVRMETREWDVEPWRDPLPGEKVAFERWNVASRVDPTSRHRIYRELYWLVRPLGHQEREVVLEALRAQAGDDGRARTGYRPLTPDEVCALAGGALVEIAAHTVTHPMLATQSRDVQRWEITASKRRLEEILGRRVTAFCYPFGLESDVGDVAPRLAEEAGFKIACCSVARPVSRRAGWFWVPRFYVGAWGGDELARRMRYFA
jgi:peptidoglycan/xylan/chitin deacetylase (PgdA/CDA1 family)